MPRRRKGKVEIKIRLYPDRDDELIQWQAQFDGQPYGVKTQAVKEALRRGIGIEHVLRAKSPFRPQSLYRHWTWSRYGAL